MKIYLKYIKEGSFKYKGNTFTIISNKNIPIQTDRVPCISNGEVQYLHMHEYVEIDSITLRNLSGGDKFYYDNTVYTKLEGNTYSGTCICFDDKYRVIELSNTREVAPI